jgi:hypothetical protein
VSGKCLDFSVCHERKFYLLECVATYCILSRLRGCEWLIDGCWIDDRIYCTLIRVQPLYDTMFSLFITFDYHLLVEPNSRLTTHLELRNSINNSELYYDRRSVCPKTKHPSRAYDQISVTVWPLRSFDMGRPLWREDGSIFYDVQCTMYNIFYCLRFETRSLYLYPPGTGWPGYNPRHWVLTLLSELVIFFTTDSQPASLSWNKAPIWGFRPDFVLMSDNCGFVDVGCPLWREVGSVICYVQCTVYLHFTCYYALFFH